MKTNKKSKNTLKISLMLLGIAVILSFGVNSVAAANTTNSSTLFVNTQGNDSWDGQLAVWNGTSGPKRTIASATSAVYPNGTVYIDNGTYNESNIPILWNMKIIGDDQNDTVIDAQGHGSIFTIMPGVNVTIANLKLTNGNSLPGYGGIYGGAICNFGNLNVTDCTFTNNTAQNINFLSFWCGDGGAIYNREGTLTVTNSTFTGNIAGNMIPNALYCGVGGAIYNHGGTLTVINSIFTNNIAQNSGINALMCGDGGAIYNDAGTLTVTNSIFTGNLAQNSGPNANLCGDGGAIYNKGTVLNANGNWWGSNRGPYFNPQGSNNIYGFGVNNWLSLPPVSVLDVRVATDSVHNFTGRNVTLTAYVTDYNGNPEDGWVTFTVGNTTLDPVPVLGGLATYNWQIPLNWSVGSYNLIANFNGLNYYNSLKAGILTVDPPIPTDITVTPVDNYAGQNVTLTANITDTYSNPVNEGQVTFTVNHDGTIVNTGTASVNNGRASLNWTIPNNWNIGSYTLTATFDGTGTNYTNSTNTSILTVDPTPTTVTVDPAENYPGQTVTLTAHVNAGGSPIGDMGIVIFIIDGNPSHGDCIQPLDTEGVATCIWTIPSDWTAGNYNITAIFNGLVNNYLHSTGKGILTVDKTPTNLTVSNANDFWHQYVDITANLTDYYGNPLNNENITFTIAGDPNTYNAVTGANGLATLHYHIIQNAGNYVINAVFNGDNGYLASTTLNGNLTVDQAPTNVNVNAVHNFAGQTVTLTAHVNDYYNNPVNGGQVTFTVNHDGTIVNVGTASADSSGVATLNWAIPSTWNVDSYTITADFDGTGTNYANSTNTNTLTVDPTPTNVIVNSVHNFAGQTVTLTANVNDYYGHPLNEGTVNFTVNGVNAGTVSVVNGLATLTWIIPNNWNVNSYVITADFNGTGTNYYNSTDSSILTVDPTPTNTSVDNVHNFAGQSTILTAHVTNYYNNPVNEGQVNFTVNGNRIGTVDLNGSIATLNWTIPNNWTAGIYNILAEYIGTDNYTVSNSTGNLTVDPTPTNIAISNVTGVDNQTVTLNATLTDIYGNPLSNQPVNFNINGNSIGNATTNNNGVATIQYTPTSTGNYAITVNYQGNQDYVDSQGTGTLIVKPAAYLYLNYTIPNNPTAGETFTITYKLSNKGPDNATNVTISFQIPEGLEFIGASVDSGNLNYNPNNRTITWILSNVAVGDPYLYLQVKPLKAGRFTINPTITSMTFNQNTQKIPSLIINAVKPPVNNGSGSSTISSNGSSVTVKAANKITLQNTGLPLNYLILAILMIVGVLVPRRK